MKFCKIRAILPSLNRFSSPRPLTSSLLLVDMFFSPGMIPAKRQSRYPAFPVTVREERGHEERKSERAQERPAKHDGCGLALPLPRPPHAPFRLPSGPHSVCLWTPVRFPPVRPSVRLRLSFFRLRPFSVLRLFFSF